MTWSSYGSSGTDSSYASIHGQRYASDGSPVGGEFQVNTYTTGYQYSPAVSPDGSGGFVVVWSSYGSSGSDSSFGSIQGQRYASDGSPVGGEFQVNTYTTSYQLYPAVSLDGSGGFIVAWDSVGSSGADSSGQSVQGQRYAADGSPVGGEFQVNTYSTGYQYNSAVSPDGSGGFVVTWESYGSSGTDSSGQSIQGQRYAADGSPAGSEFQVNTYTTSLQASPAVSTDDTGGFVITWSSSGSSGTDSSGQSIQGQRYATDGSPSGGEFQVNTFTTSYQYYPGVGLDGAGGFVVTWQSYGSSGTDSSSASIQGQRFANPEIFADGFESGDTSAWSTTVP